MLTAALLAALACLTWPGRLLRASPSWGGRDRADLERTAAAGERYAARWGMGERAAATWAADARRRVREVRRRRAVGDGWVADFAEVVAVGLEAGLALPSAALASARSPAVLARAPWLADRLAASTAQGRGVTTLLDAAPDLTDEKSADLAFLVAAWRLAEGVGAAASTITSAAAAAVRERRAAAGRTAVVIAGPRASMLLLSALPLAGPAAAVLVGLPPGRLYDTPAARVLGVGGLLMTALGWWWARGMLRRAQRPGRTDGVAR